MSKAESRTEDRSGSLIVQVVTCRKSPAERRASAMHELNRLPMALETEFVDGFIAEDTVIDELYDAAANRRRCKRPISRAEVGVYASHRLAWRRLLDSDHAAALVLEDDFGFRDDGQIMGVLENWPAVLGEDRDIVKLFDFEKRAVNRPMFLRRVGGVDLVKWRSPTAGMVAYLISRQGAQKFLARERIFRPVDEDVKYFWELGLDIWSVPGNPVIEVSARLGGSLVDTDRGQTKTRRLVRSVWGNLLTADRKIRTRLQLQRERLRRRFGKSD
jgi:GR25 family glycosyltransferase involved in LPS biosynthesis